MLLHNAHTHTNKYQLHKTSPVAGTLTLLYAFLCGRMLTTPTAIITPRALGHSTLCAAPDLPLHTPFHQDTPMLPLLLPTPFVCFCVSHR